MALKPGGHASGFVVVKNLSATAGTVLAPGCASGPRGATGLATSPFTARVKAVCAPAGKATVVYGHRSHTWEWSWNATVDGRRASPPLAPGSYTFVIGGATVAVTVTP